MEQRISFLLQQRLEQKLTTAEADELLAVLQNPEYDTLVTDKLEQLAALQLQGPALDPVDLQRWVQGIVAVDKVLGEMAGSGDVEIDRDLRGVVGSEAMEVDKNEVRKGMAARPVHRIDFLRTAWFRYAAILLLLIGAGYLFYNNFYKGKIIPQLDYSKGPDIAPGGDKAVLTLADGSVIVLDSAANGLLSQQGSTRVTKSASGQLAYEAGAGNVPGAGVAKEADIAGVMKYNTISIPRGGQYQVQLPDGSKVWLNSSSSLRFPTAFYGTSRQVEITGEAYFEIAKDVNKPFYVKANRVSVEVLGTHFNINAYTDEPVVKTTLLEGSVRVKKAGESVVMTPGQEAQVINTMDAAGTAGLKGVTGTAIKLVNDADLEEAVAWKNGLFHLTSADIGTIMRQLVRWYDVDVVFEGGIPSGHITGEVPRNTSLAKVLKVFETSGVHFRIEGKKIIVTP